MPIFIFFFTWSLYMVMLWSICIFDKLRRTKDGTSSDYVASSTALYTSNSWMGGYCRCWLPAPIYKGTSNSFWNWKSSLADRTLAWQLTGKKVSVNLVAVTATDSATAIWKSRRSSKKLWDYIIVHEVRNVAGQEVWQRLPLCSFHQTRIFRQNTEIHLQSFRNNCEM